MILYFRYLCEFYRDGDVEQYLVCAEKSYKEAYELAEKSLPISSTTRLGTGLNYSVLLFEIIACAALRIVCVER